ncbi:hypothetical protein BDY17DRAFT_289886 [Neohortaea acidophila]|uniref:Tetratricopeptide repeat protein 15 n=1 Tax=Neohortaea acidophila TaxID=245834 RepID=A0A6A6Q7B3_9PEZI|nr:uncharacterized protein BDY17DRAFT_289886 [Neohortaea acidophila]KAF2487884.1 hypothetical protein BDY17DRAFT_289886 [Neohortaea acidophila]
MDSTRSPTGSVRRHLPRRSTRGPLDAADDPLSPLATSITVPSAAASTHSGESASRLSLDTTIPDDPHPRFDLAFLQNPPNYLPIPTDDLPEPFLKSPNQPPDNAPLEDLLRRGLFRRAAQKALFDLLQCAPTDAPRLFQLLYTRLACLVLIFRSDIATHESIIIVDFLTKTPPDELVSVIPWELRLLLVRLHSIAAADGGRKGIMSLYALAAEARQHIKAAQASNRDEELKVWSVRLQDLGLRVADMLVEMGELETATRHLDTLTDVDTHELAYRRALLQLGSGDVAGARTSIDQLPDSIAKGSLEAIFDTACGDYTKAIEQWQDCGEKSPTYALSTSNLAVGLLYTGRIAEAKHILESLAARVPAFPGMLFNLSTVYELCTEQAVARKTALVQSIATKDMTPDAGGWERPTFEFKL